jgi:hypothetical protein
VSEADRTQRAPQPLVLFFFHIGEAIQVLKDSLIVAPASLMLATAISYDKPGYASVMSCNDIPSARFSNKTSIGIRVPRNTSRPPITSGSDVNNDCPDG